MATLEEILSKLVDIEGYLVALPSTLLIRAGQIVIVSGLSDISETLGCITAGEFRAGNREEPGQGFSGMRTAYPPMTYDSDTWNLVGVENDVMQFGVRAADGMLVAGGGSVVLSSTGISALAGEIGGWSIGDTTLSSTNLTLDSAGSIYSNDYTSELEGWKIDGDGTAEFNNVAVRGSIRASVLSYNEVQVTNGTQLIAKAAAGLYSDLALDSSTDYVIYLKPADLGSVALAVGDQLNVRTGTYSTWFKVVSAGSTDADYDSYNVTYESGDNDVTYYAGAPIADYGTSTDGYILLTADLADSPRISLMDVTGDIWSGGITEAIRIGNLENWQSSTQVGYGVSIGNVSANQYMTYNLTDGLLVRGTINADAGYLGNLTITGVLSTAATDVYPHIEISTNEVAGYSSSTGKEFWISASDGKAYAGEGWITLGQDGLACEYQGVGFETAIMRITTTGGFSVQPSDTEPRRLTSLTKDGYLEFRDVGYVWPRVQWVDTSVEPYVTVAYMGYSNDIIQPNGFYFVSALPIKLNNKLLAPYNETYDYVTLQGSTDYTGIIYLNDPLHLQDSAASTDYGKVYVSDEQLLYDYPDTDIRYVSLSDPFGTMWMEYMTTPYLRGFWPMSTINASSQPLDLSGQDLTLTNNGSVGFSSTYYGLAYAGTGSSKYLSRADTGLLDITGDLTMMGWFKATSLASGDGLISKWGTTGASGGYMIYLTGSDPYYPSFLIEDSSGNTFTIQSTVAMDTTNWHFIAGCFDAGTSISIFHNGTWTTNTTSPVSNIRNNAIALELGAWNTASHYFTGAITLVALSAHYTSYIPKKIERIYRAGKSLFP